MSVDEFLILYYIFRMDACLFAPAYQEVREDRRLARELREMEADATKIVAHASKRLR